MRGAQHPVRAAFIGLCLALVVVPALAQDVAEAQAACERDVARLCSGNDAPDERRILACLLPDRTRLSPACRHSANTRDAAITLAATEVEPAPQH